MLTNRYSLFKIVEVDNNDEYDLLSSNLSFMNLSTATTFRVPQAAVGRPDLISFKMYETTEYWWLILVHNDIIDPIDELYTGRVLEIPSLNDYYDFYNQNAKRGRRR